MSSPQGNSVQMANPPKGSTKLVKIRTKQAIRLVRDGAETIVKEGAVVEVTEAEAAEYCDRDFDLGYKNVFGNVDPYAVKKTVIRRAERV